MKILVSGANGFIGRSLCSMFAQHGHAVVPAVRQACGLATEVVVGEIDGTTAWESALAACDTVVHLAARVHVMHDTAVDSLALYRSTNVDATLNLARQAADIGVRRFVFLSSIKVNGEITPTGIRYRENDSPQPHDAYSVSKWEAEQGLLALAHGSGMEVVIIRPPLVYGPGVRGNFASLVKWIDKGIPLPLGAVKNKRSLVALDNLVSFICLCADRERSPKAANEVFLISDGEDVSTTELLCKVSKVYGKYPRLIPVPMSWLRTVLRLLGKEAMAARLLGSLMVDSTKARSLLGWQPMVSMDQQLQKMARLDRPDGRR